MHLIADGLVVDQNTVFDQIPAFGFNTLIVPADGTQ